MVVNERNGPLVASFPVDPLDQIMLVTDGGQLIRCPVQGIRVAGRGTQGVIVFDTAQDEKVVSVERISDEGEEEVGDLPDAEEPPAEG
jgi:DNA gyrase subunit A